MNCRENAFVKILNHIFKSDLSSASPTLSLPCNRRPARKHFYSRAFARFPPRARNEIRRRNTKSIRFLRQETFFPNHVPKFPCPNVLVSDAWQAERIDKSFLLEHRQDCFESNEKIVNQIKSVPSLCGGWNVAGLGCGGDGLFH